MAVTAEHNLSFSLDGKKEVLVLRIRREQENADSWNLECAVLIHENVFNVDVILADTILSVDVRPTNAAFIPYSLDSLFCNNTKMTKCCTTETAHQRAERRRISIAQ